MSFRLSPDVDRNKVFLVNRSELEGRHDPFYYIPKLVELDRRIKARTKYRLKDFLKFRASGATPSKSNEKYYSDSQNGIPFVRVQNLSITGELDVNELVYISKDIHEGLLKRSQVKEHDLLIKITGVGRMAVASIAPDGFEGNINQHIVVVRTGSKELSENIAAFLNLDSVENIATKRTTGGTRPALDYSALFSIPVINNRNIYLNIKKAVVAKKQKEVEAQWLLDSIDDYLLSTLGIKIPKKDNSLSNRIFKTTMSKVSGNRFDPKLYDKHTQKLFESIEKSKYPKIPLKSLILHSSAGDWGLDENIEIENYEKCLVLRATEFDNNFNLNISNSRAKYRKIRKEKLLKLDIQENDLIIEKSGGSPDQPVGRIALLTKEILNEQNICYSNFIHKIRIDESQILPEYLFCFLKTIHNIKVTDIMQSQTSGIRNLIMREYLNQSIVVPEDLEIQKQISNKGNRMRFDAKQLFVNAKDGFEKACQKVEKIIFEER